MILYEDRAIIVCHKPAGLAVQSARPGQKDMVSVLNNYLAQQGRDASRDGIRVVHRLDQPVEGVMVFAKTKAAAAFLGQKIAENSLKKTYRAVCCMTEAADASAVAAAEHQPRTLVDYLVKDGRTNSSYVAEKSLREAKRAELSYRVLKRKTSGQGQPEYLLAEIDLKTGRHHQIRVQMAQEGLPLYGDRKYNENWEQYLTEEDRSRRNVPAALCAVGLSFPHPETKMWKTFRIQPGHGAFLLFE